MEDRKKVYFAIDEERDYQDEQPRQGRFETKVYSVGEEIVMMEVYLRRAAEGFTDNYGDGVALHVIRKVVALGVRCMENHGIKRRHE